MRKTLPAVLAVVLAAGPSVTLLCLGSCERASAVSAGDETCHEDHGVPAPLAVSAVHVSPCGHGDRTRDAVLTAAGRDVDPPVKVSVVAASGQALVPSLHRPVTNAASSPRFAPSLHAVILRI